MNNLSNPDQDLIHRLSGTTEQRKQALQAIFQNKDLRSMVFSYILRHGGDEEDGREIFQEAILQFERAVREGRFAGDSSISTYFVGIVKWHWLNTRRKAGKHSTLNPEKDLSDPVESVEVSVMAEETKRLLQTVLKQMSERCQQLLRLWGLSLSPEEICAETGFSSPEMAKKETYRCRVKLKEFLDTRPHLREALKN